eukprot:Amastigsp_a19270_5.p3 type:complete len:214 gc:universal Amastigsp_a19270_5:84-725(+)
MARRARTPDSKSRKISAPYERAGGSGRTRTTASVTMPSMPSDPRARARASGPIDTRGAMQCRSRVPCGVTSRTETTKSSMLPYKLRCMPDARVAIQPPNVENSNESGSWPSVTPNAPRADARSSPTAPASTHAVSASWSTHLTACIRCMFTTATGRRSHGGTESAFATEVPPPKGTSTTSHSTAAATSASTASCVSGQTTTSGSRGSPPCRSS